MGTFRITHTIYLNIDQENRLAKVFEKVYGEKHPITGNVLRDIIMDYCTKMENLPLGTAPEPLVPQKPEEIIPIPKATLKYMREHPYPEMKKL